MTYPHRQKMGNREVLVQSSYVEDGEIHAHIGITQGVGVPRYCRVKFVGVSVTAEFDVATRARIVEAALMSQFVEDHKIAVKRLIERSLEEEVSE